MGSKVTIQDIADSTGFSSSTISLIMRNQGNFKPETTQMVMDTATELGYKKNSAKSQRNLTFIALIVDDIQNPYFQILYSHLNQTLDNTRYFLTMLSSEDSISRQSQILQGLCKNSTTGGIILVPATGTQDRDLALYKNIDIPLILAVRPVKNTDFNYVGHNATFGMKLATEHLIDCGVKEIYFIGGYRKNIAYADRYAGYASVLAYHNIPIKDKWLHHGGASREFGYTIMNTLIGKNIRPQAIIGYNDFVALGVMQALFEHNISVGKDIKIVGYDNIPEAKLRRTPLTTVENPTDKIALIISQFINAWGQDLDAPTLNLSQTPKLIIRNSCGTP